MYYVDVSQIEQRLKFIQVITQAINELRDSQEVQAGLVQSLAAERSLHLAIECVTDIGSFMIDGLMMREASSYEDIIDVLYGEQVFSAKIKDNLKELVSLRRPLIQHYYSWDRSLDFPDLLFQLPNILEDFSASVKQYLVKELDEFSTE